MKKAFNIFSYLLNVFFITVFVIGFIKQASDPKNGANEQQNKYEQIKQGIIERERADIPLNVQSFKNVYDITIDDFVFTNDVEPYSGYLVTTWDIDEKQNLSPREWAANNYENKYIRKQRKVYVKIEDITVNNGNISWNNNWRAAYIEVMIKQ